jgi:hypothetical protein
MKPIVPLRFDVKCDKCGAEESDYKLGDVMQYNLCSDCQKDWMKFHIQKERAKILDDAYRKPQWKQVWESVFLEFLKKETKEKVQFT